MPPTGRHFIALTTHPWRVSCNDLSGRILRFTAADIAWTGSMRRTGQKQANGLHLSVFTVCTHPRKIDASPYRSSASAARAEANAVVCEDRRAAASVSPLRKGSQRIMPYKVCSADGYHNSDRDRPSSGRLRQEIGLGALRGNKMDNLEVHPFESFLHKSLPEPCRNNQQCFRPQKTSAHTYSLLCEGDVATFKSACIDGKFRQQVQTKRMPKRTAVLPSLSHHDPLMFRWSRIGP